MLKIICLIFAVGVFASCPLSVMTQASTLMGVYVCLAMPAGAAGFYAWREFRKR